MLDRIVADANVLRGKPRIRGTRISVEFILELAASGASRQDIVAAFPHLTQDDVEAALRYAAHALTDEMVLTAEVAA